MLVGAGVEERLHQPRCAKRRRREVCLHKLKRVPHVRVSIDVQQRGREVAAHENCSLQAWCLLLHACRDRHQQRNSCESSRERHCQKGANKSSNLTASTKRNDDQERLNADPLRHHQRIDEVHFKLIDDDIEARNDKAQAQMPPCHIGHRCCCTPAMREPKIGTTSAIPVKTASRSAYGTPITKRPR